MATTAAASPLVQALNQALTRYPSLDPNAVRAVASQEGLSGGIGDGGHAFGPFQLNNAGGAYPSSQPQDPQGAEAWANSPAGLDYALSRIVGVAGGLKGQSAINNIVSRFERPANPQREIQGASAAYGGLPPAAPFAMPGAAASGGVTPQAEPGVGGRVPTASPILAALKLLGFS